MSDGPRTHRSYRPGDWFGIFGDRTTVLLPPGEKARVPALWQLLDDGAGFDEALDALVAGGLRGLPGFVLLSEEDGTTRIVVRGAARARLSGADGELELEGSDAATWVERTARGVTRVVVQVSTGDDAGAGDPEPSSALRIDGGLARVSRVDQPPYAGAAVDVLAESVAPADDDLGGADAPDDGVFAQVEATADEEPVAETSPAYDDEETQAIAWSGLPAQDAASDGPDDPTTATTATAPTRTTGSPSGSPRTDPRTSWPACSCPPASWWTWTGWCSWGARRTRGASPTPGNSRGWSPWTARTRRSPRPTSRSVPAPVPTPAWPC